MSTDECQRNIIKAEIEVLNIDIDTLTTKYNYIEEVFEEQKEKLYLKLYDLNVEKVRLQVQLEALKDES